MIHDNINISCLTVHAIRVEEASVKRKSKDAKRARSYDGCFPKNSLEIHDKPRCKKRVSNQIPSKLKKSGGYRLSNPILKNVKGIN